MNKKAFDKIAAGLNEALEIARGNANPSKLYIPSKTSVREIRKRLTELRKPTRIYTDGQRDSRLT